MYIAVASDKHEVKVFLLEKILEEEVENILHESFNDHTGIVTQIEFRNLNDKYE